METLSIIRINTNGTVEFLDIENSLKGYYEAIGNGCDMVESHNTINMENASILMDEEARIRRPTPPLNPLADFIFAGRFLPGTKILGNVLLVGRVHNGVFLSVSDSLKNRIKGMEKSYNNKD